MNYKANRNKFGSLFCLLWSVLVVASTGFASGELVNDGCTNPFACNYDEAATDDDGSCEYLSCIGCMNEFACNYDSLAIYPDASCEYFSCAGCTAPLACNYDIQAIVPDEASCDFESCAGCTDFTACNFDPEATLSTPVTCEYPQPDYDCSGNLQGCVNCAPVFLFDFEPDTVACLSDFSSGPNSEIVAIDPSTGDTLETGYLFAEQIESYQLNLASTSEGAGPDGAIRLFGLAEQLGLANSDYFVESFPLIVTRYSNGIARVTGQVSDAENPNLKWNLHLVLEDAQLGNDWLAENPDHDFVTSFGCVADTANWVTYRLDNTQSYLIGGGGYEGSWLQLSHMPYEESKRFQLGEGGNGVNCEYGLGGWFAWEGAILGQSVMGMSGDLVVDLGTDIIVDVPCGSEFTAEFYNALNPNSGEYTEAVQFTYAEDTTAPNMESSCENTVSLCFEPNIGVAFPEPCSFEEDNCGGALEISFTEAVVSGNPNAGNLDPFEIERTYEASDCSGNATTFTQTLSFAGENCDGTEDVLDSPFGLTSESQTSEEFSGAQLQQNTPASHSRKTSSIAPNPTESTSTLKLERWESEKTVIRVFNLAGKEAMPSITIAESESNASALIPMNASALIPGCYLVRIESASAVETIRWVVSR